MNFYQMDVYEIERYLRNNSVESSELCKALIEKLTEITVNYEQLTDVLDYHGLSNYNAKFLDSELKEIFTSIDNLEYELKQMKDEA